MKVETKFIRVIFSLSQISMVSNLSVFGALYVM